MIKNIITEKDMISNLTSCIQYLIVKNGIIRERLQSERGFRDQVTEISRKTYSVDEFLSNIFPQLQKVIDASKGSIVLKSQDPLVKETHFYIVVQNGISEKDVETKLMSLEKGKFISKVLGEGQSIVIDLKRKDHHINSIIVPFGWNGVTQGAVCFSNKSNQNNFTEDDKKTLVSCVRDLEYGIKIILQERSHLEAIATFVEQKDPYTAAHSKRVGQLARLIAFEDGLSVGDQNMVETYGRLHDIGKIVIPDSVLLKNGSLDDIEFRNIKQHPEKGEAMLLRFNKRVNGEFKNGREIIRHHHEKYDGKGYPDRLGGDDIPKFSRILSIADAFDAMASNRCYRSALPTNEILKRINKNIGKQFDPNYAKLFLDMLPSIAYANVKDDKNLYHSPFCPDIPNIEADSFFASTKSDFEKRGFRPVESSNNLHYKSTKANQVYKDEKDN